MLAIRERLATRLPGLPTDEALREHLSALGPDTLRTLLESGAWDTLIVGGEEADIDLFYRTDAPVYVPRPDPRADMPAHVPQPHFRSGGAIRAKTAVIGVGDLRRLCDGRVRSWLHTPNRVEFPERKEEEISPHRDPFPAFAA
ncbi:hypothetical protein [Streptomyces sp. NPDC050982]|uniref:hypothetical protein n=1 Tax=Streptomyces sp. NPDC050982 TaxID=3154746 RepID=UPI0033C975E1